MSDNERVAAKKIVLAVVQPTRWIVILWSQQQPAVAKRMNQRLGCLGRCVRLQCTAPWFLRSSRLLLVPFFDAVLIALTHAPIQPDDADQETFSVPVPGVC